jgi:hypothetical protein
MAIDTLQPESACATPGIDPKLFLAAGEMMGLAPDHPKVIDRVTSEEHERAALEYAAGAVSAAMDALAALDALDFAQYLDRPGDMDAQQRDTVDRLLRMTRRNLRAAVGSCAHPGYDPFMGMLSAHGLCIYGD